MTRVSITEHVFGEKSSSQSGRKTSAYHPSYSLAARLRTESGSNPLGLGEKDAVYHPKQYGNEEVPGEEELRVIGPPKFPARIETPDGKSLTREELESTLEKLEFGNRNQIRALRYLAAMNSFEESSPLIPQRFNPNDFA